MKLISFSRKTLWNILFAQNHLTVPNSSMHLYFFLCVKGSLMIFLWSIYRLWKFAWNDHAAAATLVKIERERERTVWIVCKFYTWLSVTWSHTHMRPLSWWWCGLSLVLSDLGYIYLDAYNIDEVYIYLRIWHLSVPSSGSLSLSHTREGSWLQNLWIFASCCSFELCAKVADSSCSKSVF